jgi:hypothetical protein
VKGSQIAVSIYKQGKGYEFTYEFMRRTRLDVLTPFSARLRRQVELSKCSTAYNTLLNGDGINSPAPVTYQAATWGGTSVVALEYKPLLTWLVTNAAQGTPISRVVGNADMYVQWLSLFTPTTGNIGAPDVLAAKGAPVLNAKINGLLAPVEFVLNFDAADGILLGFNYAETLTELVEQGSTLEEREQAIKTQRITMVRSECTGYSLNFADTRHVYSVPAA